MANWNFNAEEVEVIDFAPLAVGDHRVRIAVVEETTSKSGNEMFKIVFDVSGHNGSLWYYLVLMADNTKLTNTKLSQFWNCFGLPAGNFQTNTWVGKIGAVRVKHEQYNGENQAKVAYLLDKDKQESLPVWVEPSNKASYTGNGATPLSVEVNDDELPF